MPNGARPVRWQRANVTQSGCPAATQPAYFQALEQSTRARAELLLVGRGGCWLLRDDPTALHVHLVAARATRLRRVMEYRWVREDVAKKLIAQSDAQRRCFCEDDFGADWSDPLEYHLTVNSGRLGPLAVDVVARAAERHWSTSAFPG